MRTKNHNQVQFLRYGVTQFFLSFKAIFCPPHPPSPPNTPENQNFEKMKKGIQRCHHFKLVQQKTQSNDACFLSMERDRHNFFLSFQASFCSFTPLMTLFLPCHPPNNPKNQNFEKIKNTPGDIIILHLCTTNDNLHVQFLIYQAEYITRQNFFVILGYILPLYPLTIQKIKSLKK